MKNLYSKGLILLIFSFLTLTTNNQLLAQVTTVGKQFWLGFMENNRIFPSQNSQGALDIGIIVITANEASEGIIEYAGNTITFNILAGQEFVHRITSFDILHRFSGEVEEKGVYILSSGKISVYAFNERFRSGDGTVVLPISTLGKDYYITSHFQEVTKGTNIQGLNSNNESILLVVGVEDNTDIEITPTVNTESGQVAGVPFIIRLNLGQSYQLKARGDLTGSRVRVIGANVNECKNIAVFGGNKWTAVGDCGQANDHLFQQAYPVNTWGKDFLHVPLAGRNSGELVKVLASEANSEIFINGTSVGILGQGEFLSRDFSSTEAVSISSDKPISVTGFAKSMACNLPGAGNNIGDPFMITYSPNQQLLSRITFNALQLPSINAHFVNIITATASIQNTRLDGQNVGSQFVPFPSNPDFSYTQIEISSGVHQLENNDGLIGYVYGFGQIESYGFAVGASLENLNFEVFSGYDFEVDGEAVACLNQSAEWEINPENDIFQFFNWNFGDGSEIKKGKLVEHVYSEPGTYEVIVTASISEISCDQQEEVRFEVLVEEYLGEIIGSISVCPNIDEIKYQLEIDKEISRIEWKVEGGEIIAQNDDGIVVRWGPENPTAKVIAQPFSIEGCPGEVVELIVKINNQIEPKFALGEEKICYDGSTLYDYTTAEFIIGRGYEWFVVGGDIFGSKENNTVQVNWSIPGTIGQVWYREFSLINDDCEGISPLLEVVVNTVFTAKVDDPTEILCFGEETGRIEVNVAGGLAPYTFKWSHDENINSPVAEGIPAGTYSVTVTDDFGCQIMLEDIVISQPDILEVVSISRQGVSCFGRSDGEAVIQIRGGLPPYALDIPGATINGTEISFLNLEGREFSGIATDINGCQLPISFTIDSPLPLTADVRIQKFSCPGEANGELIVEPMGGFDPFTYIWDHDGSQSMVLTAIQKGEYTVSVQDSRGCISFGTGEMLEEEPKFRMPTGFRPEEGLYEGVSNCLLTYQLSIYNRWGELIFLGSEGWDGTVKGEEASLGTYIYIIQYEYNLNGKQTKKESKGLFSLLR